ncbi:MAG: cell division protein FtsQ/DivIB [Blastocatellales bacterium]
MAGRRNRQQEEEPEALELEDAEEEFEQEALAQGEVEDEVEPEPRPSSRRTTKTRAPRRSATAPVSRQRASRRDRPGRRDPRQLSLFSRLSPERFSQNVTRTGGSILISLLAIGGLIVLFHLFAGSRFFALRGVDVKGNSLLSVDEVETMVKAVVPRGVLNADLDQIRSKLESYPLIREAEVARLLPDRLRVRIVERQPIALARRGSSVVCVDDDGVMFGDSSYWRGKTMPPVISGLAESGENASETNRRWIMTYKRLMAELDQSEPPLSSRIDEIHFDEDQGVRLTLADKREAVLIGREDFRTRLNAALDVLDAVRRKDADALNVLRISDAERLLGGTKIAYLNATDPKRVIVGLDE